MEQPIVAKSRTRRTQEQIRDLLAEFDKAGCTVKEFCQLNSIERWEKLSLYTKNGMLNIDNNPVENSIRPVALGRKNYLFAGSHEAAKRSGMLYSLLGTCKMHGIEPYIWLKNVLQRIPIYPINKVQELLPHRWCK